MKTFRIALLLTGLVVCAPFVASAEAPVDKGKKLLPKLFESVVADASDATARIQVDGKDVSMGTVVGKTGYILTKGSELRSSAITVKFRDGTCYDAEYVGYHKPTDLALLKIEADDLTAVKFVAAKNAEPGNWVAATADSSEPVAVGIISAGARKLFGIESVIENANKGYIGIRFDVGGKDQVVIAELVAKAAAAKAGLKVGDIIVEVAGEKVKNRDHLPEILDRYKPSDRIAVKVLRKVKDSDETEEMTFNVTLSPKSAMGQDEMMNLGGGLLSGRRTGFPQVIQHDMVLSPKDCGGPLVDLDGRVVGLNIARAGRVETWALPAEVITPVLKELQDGKYPAPKLPKSTKPVEK